MPRWVGWTLGVAAALVLGCAGAVLFLWNAIDDPMSGSLPFLADPRPASVLVRVVGPDARAVAGAQVEAAWELDRWSRPRVDEVAAPPRVSAVTDADGIVELTGLGLGTWRIVVRAPGMCAGGATVSGGNAGRKRLDLRLAAANVVRGRVVDEDGAPVAGAEVRTGGDDPLGPATTDAAGLFSLDDVPAGDTEILVRRAGDVDAACGTFRVPADDVIAVAVGPVRRLPVRVKDPQGAPVPGARLALRIGGWRGQVVRATTGADGTCSVPVTLAPGGAHVIIHDADVVAPALCLPRFSEGSVYVAPGSKDALQLELVAACSVTGTVTDPAGFAGGALVAATFDYQGAAGLVYGRRETTADAQGNFRIDGLPAVRLGIYASAAPPGRSAAMTFVNGTPAGTATAAIALPRDTVVRTPIRGTVVSAAGPVDRATVTVLGPGDSGPQPIAEASTGPDGTFTTVGVPVDLGVSLEIRAAGLRPFETSVQPAEDFAGPDTYRLADGVRIDGTLVTPGEAPLRDARVWLVPSSDRDAFGLTWGAPGPEAVVAVGPDGRFSALWCQRGGPVVCATAAGLAPSASPPLSIAVVDGRPVTPPVHLALDEGATLRGRLLDPDGKPLARRLVALRPVGTSRESAVVFTQTDAGGRFVVEHLARGAVVVTPRDRASLGFRGVRVVPGGEELDIRLRSPARDDRDSDDDR